MTNVEKPNTAPNVDTEPREKLLTDGPAEVTIEKEPIPALLYNVSDRIPIHLAIFFAFQQTLIALSAALVVSSFVADVACASDIPDIRRDLLSSTLLMNGVTTLMMVTIGARLPLFQGPAADYVIPLLAMQMVDPDVCKIPDVSGTDQVLNVNITMDNINTSFHVNTTDLHIMEIKRDFALTRLCQFQGCLILVGIIHCLVGLTGIAGILLRFIGPITVVSAIFLAAIFLSRTTAKLARVHWGLSALTAITSLLLSLYLGHLKMPCPAWSRKKGLHLIWYPFHQVLSILIGLLVGWGASALMTATGMLTDDPSNTQYMARTDARADIVSKANWFKVPYPNQFGTPTFDVGVFIAFLLGTITSILDSIGDYYACARTCNVPPPPRYVVNRGLAVEGIGSALSGIMGCGHATTTYGGNIGALGLTKVASRDVLIWTAFIYIVFGLIGKVSAVFITIPLPVLGGTMIVMYGMFNGIVLSNLQAISLSSTRNLAVIGTSLLVGLMVPYWLETYPDDLQTGSSYGNHIVKTLLSNPILCGGALAAFLDNTVPGTAKERGITAWQEPEKSDQPQNYAEGLDVYEPLIPTRWLSWKVMKYLPFCQYKAEENSRLGHKD